MKKDELSSGVFIAQGPEVNVLIRLEGKSPMLRVIGAIDLNQFYRFGKVVELETNSLVIQDIIMYPEKYQFEAPNISSTVFNEEGYEAGVGRDEDTITQDFMDQCVQKYRSLIKLTNSVDDAKVKMKIWLKREQSFSISQGEAFINKLINYMNPNV